MKVILDAVPYTGRATDIDFVPDPEIVVPGAHELHLMESRPHPQRQVQRVNPCPPTFPDATYQHARGDGRSRAGSSTQRCAGLRRRRRMRLIDFATRQVSPNRSRPPGMTVRWSTSPSCAPVPPSTSNPSRGNHRRDAGQRPACGQYLPVREARLGQQPVGLHPRIRRRSRRRPDRASIARCGSAVRQPHRFTSASTNLWTTAAGRTLRCNGSVASTRWMGLSAPESTAA